MLINIFYLIILQLFDFAVTDFFNLVFNPVQLNFIPLMSFIGFVFIIREKKLGNALLIAIIFGFIQDLVYFNSYYELMIVYVIIAFINNYWSKYLNDNLSSSVILAASLIFVREVLVYFYRYLNLTINFSFLYFLIYRLFVVVVFNIILVVAVYYLNNIRIRLQLHDEYRRRRSEDLFGSSMGGSGESKE